MNVYSPQHLAEIWQGLRRHRVTGRLRTTPVGVDGVRAETFERNLEANCAEISRMVQRSGADGLPAYSFAPLIRHEKLKPNGGIRPIHIPRLRDQLVLRAMHEEVSSSASARGLSLKSANPASLVRLFRAALRPDSVVLRADIREFFDTVPRSAVVAQACALGVDELTSGLLRKWSSRIMARPPWRAGKEKDRTVDGLPQGLSLASSLSELWASKLDAAATSARAYFRYVDDIAIVCDSVRAAEDCLDWLIVQLRSLGLRLSPSKTAIVRIADGVPWLGLIHYGDKSVAEPGRPDRWLKKFAAIRREAVVRLRDPQTDKSAALADFHRAVRDEIAGRTSSRPGWYASVEDNGEWRELDRSLHAFIRSVHRLAGALPPAGRQLPSVHRAVSSRRHQLSASSTADQGPCATLSLEGETIADQGHKAPDEAELSSCGS